MLVNSFHLEQKDVTSHCCCSVQYRSDSDLENVLKPFEEKRPKVQDLTKGERHQVICVLWPETRT